MIPRACFKNFPDFKTLESKKNSYIRDQSLISLHG